MTQDKLQPGSVGAAQLSDNAVTPSKVADNSLPGTKMANASLPASKTADASLPGTKLMPGSITGSQIVAGGISTSNLANQSVTLPKLGMRAVSTNAPVGGVAVSPSSGEFECTSTSWTDAADLSVTIETSGRPVWGCLISDGDASMEAFLMVRMPDASDRAADSAFAFTRDGSVISAHMMSIDVGGLVAKIMRVPPSSVTFLDTPPAGQHRYSLRIRNISSGNHSWVWHCRLLVYEL